MRIETLCNLPKCKTTTDTWGMWTREWLHDEHLLHQQTDLEVDKRTFSFHLLDLMILNSYILLTSCRAKLLHRDFWLVSNLLEEGGRVLWMGTAPQQIPTFHQLDGCWAHSALDRKRMWQRCRVLHSQSSYKCVTCDMGLCIVSCLQIYCTQLKFWDQPHTGKSRSHNQ